MTRRFPKTACELQLTMSVDGKVLGDWDASHTRSLLEADAVEEIRVTILPMILGGEWAVSLTGMPTGELPGFLTKDRLFRLKKMEEDNGKAHLHYVRDRREKA